MVPVLPSHELAVSRIQEAFGSENCGTGDIQMLRPQMAMNHCEFRDLFSFPEAMMSNFVALVVEDDPFQRESLADLLKGEGLEVVECADAASAELVLASTGPDLRALVTDVELGGEVSGAELAQYRSVSSRP